MTERIVKLYLEGEAENKLRQKQAVCDHKDIVRKNYPGSHWQERCVECGFISCSDALVESKPVEILL